MHTAACGRRATLRLGTAFLCVCLSASAFAAGTLDLPVTDGFGDPVDVGFMVLGHSTSGQGDWPGKFAETANGDPADGRNYVVFRAIKNGDGGFLWSRLSIAPGDPQYNRVLTSDPDQYCQDNSGVRWSCRRMRMERSLNPVEQAPPECAPPNNTCTARALDCVWHEGGVRNAQALDFHACWEKMDVRLAVVQDSSNRRTPVDDFDRDGDVDDQDFFLASDLPAASRPCPSSSGVIGEALDWNCDGVLDAQDASRNVYGGWFDMLVDDLLNDYGAMSPEHVFIIHKPVTNFACGYYSEPGCGDHALRTPTPSRPFDHFYLPTVYWEHAAVEAYFQRADRDPRVHRATPNDITELWDFSAKCYSQGISPADWRVNAPWTSRPASIPADDTEDDETNSEQIGCMRADHRHHTDNGGWMMADVWYAGLRPYLQDFNAPVAEVSGVGSGALMTVTGFDAGTGEVTLSYEAGCSATDHALHAGPLSAVAGYGYDRTVCGLGTSGNLSFNAAAGDRFWLLSGRDGYSEGSLGQGSAGERPAPAEAPGACYLPQRLGGSCP